MGTEVAISKREQASQIISPLMSDIGDALINAVVRPEQFQAAFVTAVMNNPDILLCTRESIRASLLKAASDGLPADGRKAALVKYGNVCVYIPMVQGIITRAKELGEIDNIRAHIVCANDKFLWVQGDDEKIEHTPAPLGTDRGDIIGAYAIFITAGKVIHREVMDVAAINKARAVSKVKNGPWAQWYDEMARKTVIRRGSKYVPMSDKLRTLIERDDEYVDFTQAEPTRPGFMDKLGGEVVDHVPVTERVDAELDGFGSQDERVTEDGEVIDQDPAPDGPNPSAEDDFPGDRPAPAALTDTERETLRKFGIRLFATEKAENLPAQAKGFWKEGAPAKDSRMHEVASQIYNIHEQRIKDGDVEGAKAKLERVIG